MPWKKYVKADVTGSLTEGDNLIAIEDVHYMVNPNGMAMRDAPPLNATLYVEYKDGTTATFASGTDWLTAIHPANGWIDKGFNDMDFKTAVAWVQSRRTIRWGARGFQTR